MQFIQNTKSVDFSKNHELVLFLIQKELQGTRFANDLAQLGWHTPTFQTDLGGVILSLIGFKIIRMNCGNGFAKH